MSVVVWYMLKLNQCRAMAIRGGVSRGSWVQVSFLTNLAIAKVNRYGVVDTVLVSTEVSYRA